MASGQARINLPLRFVPPIRFGDGLICTGIARDSGHDSEVVFDNNLLHHLDTLEVAEHISTGRESV